MDTLSPIDAAHCAMRIGKKTRTQSKLATQTNLLALPSSWFYTSDTIVREVSIDEVLSVPAYLLFYDRGQQRQLQLR